MVSYRRSRDGKKLSFGIYGQTVSAWLSRNVQFIPEGEYDSFGEQLLGESIEEGLPPSQISI